MELFFSKQINFVMIGAYAQFISIHNCIYSLPLKINKNLYKFKKYIRGIMFKQYNNKVC